MNKKQQAAYGHAGECSFHPREAVVGVCAHCLKDRLLLLLDTDDATTVRRRRRNSHSSSISIPSKVFALGSSFLQRIDSRHHHHHHHRPTADDGDLCSDDTTSVASLDESFISIKFEDNGKATWDKVAAAKDTTTNNNNKPAPPVVKSSSAASSTAVMVEHVKRGGVTRWRKQVVGRLLHLARWRRSAATKHAVVVAGMDGNKQAERSSSKGRGGRGWIRSLTRRRHGDRAWS